MRSQLWCWTQHGADAAQSMIEALEVGEGTISKGIMVWVEGEMGGETEVGGVWDQ